jgi:hypothetical protein
MKFFTIMFCISEFYSKLMLLEARKLAKKGQENAQQHTPEDPDTWQRHETQ